MYIESTGNVGIGTATPSSKLEVSGTVEVTDIVYRNPETRYLVLGPPSFTTGHGHYVTGGALYPRAKMAGLTSMRQYNFPKAPL